MSLEIEPSSTSCLLSAQFHFGVISGNIFSHVPLPTKVGRTIPFRFHGVEEGEGEPIPEEGGNEGSITFLGGGKIEGYMYWDCGFAFEGTKL